MRPDWVSREIMSADQLSSRPGGNRFPRTARLPRKSDFDRVMKGGLRLVDERVVVWIARNESGTTRLGLTVGRRHGNAPRRNRLKRILREAFRTTRPDLPAGLDIVCTPKVGVSLELGSCRDSFLRLTQRAASRLSSRGDVDH